MEAPKDIVRIMDKSVVNTLKILSWREKNGSTIERIKNYIGDNCSLDMNTYGRLVKSSVLKAVEKGMIEKTSPRGHFKYVAIERRPKAIPKITWEQKEEPTKKVLPQLRPTPVPVFSDKTYNKKKTKKN